MCEKAKLRLMLIMALSGSLISRMRADVRVASRRARGDPRAGRATDRGALRGR